MKTERVKTVTFGEGGWRAEVYTDDDSGSGYGDNPMVGYWYGTRENCEALDPNSVTLYPTDCSEKSDPFDLACERRWD
jgi:hypothetical protein